MTIGQALKVTAVIVAAMVLVVGVVWLAQRRLIYLPDRSVPPSASEVLPGARDVTLTTSDDVDLGAWFVPAEEARLDVAVLVANGNGGNRQARAPLAAALQERGFDVLLFDYRGYGGNAGTPTEHGLARDVRAARWYLVSDAAIPPDRLIYFGESLGCAVVAELAAEHPPGGLLLRSPFTDLAAAARAHIPLIPADLLLWDEFAVADLVGQVSVPTTVVYGTADSIVPPAQSRSVAEASAGDVVVVEIDGAGHNDGVMFDGEQVLDAVVELSGRL
jgi:hypothetical protein